MKVFINLEKSYSNLKQGRDEVMLGAGIYFGDKRMNDLLDLC